MDQRTPEEAAANRAAWEELGRGEAQVVATLGRLMQGSAEESLRIMERVHESEAKRIAELELQVAYWEPLGRRFLAIKRALGQTGDWD